MSDPNAYYTFIAGLKPGDEVLVSTNSTRTIETVERLTKTQLIAGKEHFYRTGWRAGRRVGDSTAWRTAELAPVSQLDRDIRETQELQGKLRRAIDSANLPELRTLMEAWQSC